jgi:hypothetical protein
MGLALSYIEFAKEEKNLFELIASVDDFGTRTIAEFLKSEEGSRILEKVSQGHEGSAAKKQELFTMFWMFVHGMAALIAGNRVEFSEREIRKYITKAYEGFVSQT